MNELQATLLHSLQHDKHLSPTDCLLLAVSGGADSLAMLHAAVQIRQLLGLRLHVASFDHGLRGADGAADVEFVAQQAHSWNLPCEKGSGDVALLANAQQISIEAAARKARYDFLASSARRVGASAVVTAHHADDQVETILMNILRGSGMQGLQGMSYRSVVPAHDDVGLLRPLLHVSRAQIEDYCREHDLQPREDASNDDTRYRRNALRHDVLPFLRQYNPQVDAALLRLSEITAIEEDYMGVQFQREVLPHITQDQRVKIALAQFVGWHVAMQRRALRYGAMQLNAEAGFEHIEAARQILLSGQVGAQADLTKGVRARRRYTDIVIETPQMPPDTGDYLLLPTPDSVVDVQIPGITVVGEWRLRARFEASEQAVARLNVPPNAIVQLRARQAGDRFQPLGLNGHSQKIKKWLIERRIPAPLRNTLPLFIINGVIAAIVLPQLWTISEPFAEKSQSQHLIYFEVI